MFQKISLLLFCTFFTCSVFANKAQEIKSEKQDTNTIQSVVEEYKTYAARLFHD